MCPPQQDINTGSTPIPTVCPLSAKDDISGLEVASILGVAENHKDAVKCRVFQEDGDDEDDGGGNDEARDSVLVHSIDIEALQSGDSGGGDDDDGDGGDGDDDEKDDEFGEDMVLRPNFSTDPQDQWDIVAFFDGSEIWKQFRITVQSQMDAQNATDTQVPNMNVATNQEELDKLLQNLLGPNENDDDDAESNGSDSDSDDEEEDGR